ncbi:MAG: LysM peptidoglycan-binding domain-containing protein [Chloroflexota bacterium]
MTRGKQSQLIIFIMGSAIVLAAVLALAVSSGNIRQVEPEQPTLPEQVLVNGQPITLRRNPALTVLLVQPDPNAQPPPVVNVQIQPTPEPSQPEQATAVPAPTEAPAQPTAVPQGATNTPAPPPPAAVAPVITINYVVQGGDTLYRITTIRATSIALMAQYGIAQDHLTPGDTISLPIGNPDYCPGRRPYAVGEGETIYAISQKTNTSQEDLQSINQLGPEFRIQAGQILCVSP